MKFVLRIEKLMAISEMSALQRTGKLERFAKHKSNKRICILNIKRTLKTQ